MTHSLIRRGARPVGGRASALVLASLLPLLVPPGSNAKVCGDSQQSSGARDIARGTVFQDANHNGALDRGEKGITGVSVSNGCQVVQSDAEGRYSIELAPRQILFITQPSGWSVPVNAHNQPLFYVLHYPEGSAREVSGQEQDPESIEWRWPVIEPTGRLPERIDFPLLESKAPGPVFDAHAFADTQAGSELAQDMLREELLGALLGNPYNAAFSITVGDVVNDNLDLYPRHIEMMGHIGTANWYLPGNHDINFESPDAHHANDTYKRYFGPVYYSFDVGQVHFVALNNVEYAGNKGNESFDNGRYRGYISDDQLYWLERDLRYVDRDRLIVIATHIPLLTDAPGGDGRRGSDSLNTVNLDRLIELLRPFRFVYAIAGHDTSNSWKQRIDHTHGWHGQPWIAHTLAEARGNGWNRGPRDTRGVSDALMQDGNPNGFYILHFEGTGVVPEFVPFPTGPDATTRLRITLDPLPTPRNSSTTAEGSAASSIHRGVLQRDTKIVVNLFDGGERDQVFVSIDNGPEIEMKHVYRTDPTVERIYDHYRETASAIGSPALSSHIWELSLPGDLAPGVHILSVRSIDEFGQERRGHQSFELE